MTDAQTPTGVIHYGGVCRDNYENITLYDQPPPGGAPIKLQQAALRAFRNAERDFAPRWSKKRKRQGRPIRLTGSWRSCAYQRELYHRDSHRYAHPDTSAHTRGLAIDVSTAQPRQRRIKRVLRKHGWKQVRPDDEPWHWSYWITS